MASWGTRSRLSRARPGACWRLRRRARAAPERPTSRDSCTSPAGPAFRSSTPRSITKLDACAWGPLSIRARTSKRTWNAWRRFMRACAASVSVRVDSGLLDDRRPLGDFALEVRAERGGRGLALGHRLRPELLEPRDDRG